MLACPWQFPFVWIYSREQKREKRSIQGNINSPGEEGNRFHQILPYLERGYRASVPKRVQKTIARNQSKVGISPGKFRGNEGANILEIVPFREKFPQRNVGNGLNANGHFLCPFDLKFVVANKKKKNVYCGYLLMTQIKKAEVKKPPMNIPRQSISFMSCQEYEEFIFLSLQILFGMVMMDGMELFFCLEILCWEWDWGEAGIWK